MKELKIKDICTSGSSSLKQKDVENCTGPYPVYGAGGIIGYRDDYDQEEECIGIVKDGSGIGRVMFLPPKSSVIGTLQYILPKQGYDIEYIGYCLQSLGLSQYAQGAAIPHIYFRDYGERSVSVEEDIKQQRRIVDYLGFLFTTIDLYKDNSHQAYEEAKSLFKAILTEKTASRPSWKANTLGEICTIKGDYGYNYSSKPFERVRYLRITDITEWGGLNDDKVSADTQDDVSGQDLREGDLLFARTGATVGKTLFFKKEYGSCCFAGYLIRYRTNPKEILPRYLFYYTHSDTYFNWVQANQKVAAQPNISAKLYNTLQIHYPNSIEEQQKIVDELDYFYDKVISLQSNLTTIEEDCNLLKQKVLNSIFRN